MLRNVHSPSFVRRACKTAMEAVRGVPTLGEFLLSATLFSARSLAASQRMGKKSGTSKNTKSALLKRGSGMDHATAPAAYAGLLLDGTTLHIADVCNDSLEEFSYTLSSDDSESEILSWLRQSAQQRNIKYVAAGYQENEKLKDFYSKLWLQEDIVPYVVNMQESSPLTYIEGLAREVAANFDTNNIVRTRLSADHEVRVADLVSLDAYRDTTSHKDFALLVTLAQAFQGKRLVFVSATPQGGGVALMRHALIRLFRLLDVDAHWYVLIPRKEAFDITKPKFHNVLQAVASPGTELTSEDEEIYNAWMKENAAALEDAFRQADVVVIDDPQPSGLIPYIKDANPHTKIIYRSHIQIAADLVNQPGTPQHKTWAFLWNTIQHADCFISHPLKMFVPACVPDEMVMYMPATTDHLDGLNKPLTESQIQTYLQLFNNFLIEAGQKPLEEGRAYITQIARFDPSKGLPDVLDSYRRLRLLLEEQHKPIPQLIIAGNGSIDDPDGVPIYNAVMTLLQSEPYVHFADDIKVLRLPHRDQILNTLLRISSVVLQLSIKEGFEVKVTEALMKGKPVIAYRTGGIPLQIEEGINGYLVNVGDTTQVAQHLFDLLTDTSLYEQISKAAEEKANTDYLTIPNAICWLYLSVQLLKGEKLAGQYHWVKALAEQYDA